MQPKLNNSVNMLLPFKPTLLSNPSNINATREKYLRQKHLYVNDPVGYGVRSGDMKIELVDGGTYDPEESGTAIEMMETDYKH